MPTDRKLELVAIAILWAAFLASGVAAGVFADRGHYFLAAFLAFCAYRFQRGARA